MSVFEYRIKEHTINLLKKHYNAAKQILSILLEFSGEGMGVNKIHSVS